MPIPAATSHRLHANGIEMHYLRQSPDLRYGPDLRHGLDLRHDLAGKGGLPLLLLHGWPEFCGTWHRLMPLLAGEGYDLIAPDLRGFGDTEKPSPRPSAEATADVLATDLLGLADALGLERFGIVAHDVGAYAAQAFAHRHPDRLSGLFFFNCPYPGIGRRWAEAGHLIETWYQYFNQMPMAASLVGSSRETCRIYFAHFLAHWSKLPDAFEADLDRWVDNFMKPGNLQGGFNWYMASAASRRATFAGTAGPIAPIRIPTHVLWGRHDPILKVEWIDRLPEYFTKIEVEICEEAGHFVHYEAPESAARAIAAFFARMHG
jgi:pimeloyl-ACP methyl ester carboxylesterase